MALVDRASDASLDTVSGQRMPPLGGDLFAAEDLDPVAPCRIHTDGAVYMANGTNADADAEFDGFTPKAYKQGQAVSLWGLGARFHYGSGLTPGQILYLGATDGRLDDAPTTGDSVGLAKAVSTTDIRVIRAF